MSPPSQLLTNILDKIITPGQTCVKYFDGSSSSMESTGLSYIVINMFRENRCEIILGTIVIDDDTSMER